MCPEQWSGGFIAGFKIHLRKATVSVRPSVGMQQLGFHWIYFHQI